jgi:hypothetical protein
MSENTIPKENLIKPLQKEVDMASIEFHSPHQTSWTEQIGILLSVSHVQRIIQALSQISHLQSENKTLRKEKGMRWTNGRKTELLPPIDSYEDFPKKYVVRVYGDDPHSGCVYCGMETAEEMREINEDGYWEWLDESESPEQSSLSELQEELEEDLSTLVSIKDDLPKEGLGKIFVTNRIKKLQSLLTSTKEQKEDEV